MKKTTVKTWWLTSKINVFTSLLLTLALIALSNALSAQCQFQVYTGTDTLGNQQYTERLGLIFTVNNPAVVSALGAYDHDTDGLTRPITVGIIRNSDSVTVAGPITLNGTTDPLQGMFRFRNIAPVTLAPGQYTIVAVGYGPGESNGNTVAGDTPVNLNSGNGLLTFNSSSYGGVGFGYPTTPYPDNNVFHSGSFICSALVPDLSVTINDITLNTNPNEDLIDSMMICPLQQFNINTISISDDNNLSPDSLVKVIVTINLTNVNFIPPGTTISAINTFIWPAGFNATLIDPSQVGRVDIEMSAFYDYDDDNEVDDEECVTNTITFRFNLNDTIVPSIVCPSDVIVDTEEGVCAAEVIDIAPLAADNCDNFTVTYTISGSTTGSGNNDASSTVFNGGESVVEYTVTDNGIPANTATCSFTVFVEDNEAPLIECPLSIFVNLDPLECTAVVTHGLIDVSDNCALDTTYVSEGLESGDDFPIGTTEVTYTAVDTSGNESTCTFSVTVLDFVNPSLGCINRNVSLDEDCSAVVDPYMVLTGHIVGNDTLLGCLDSFYINITNPQGNNIGNVVTGDYLKKTLNYTITNPSQGFACWGTLFIEDKLPPRVVCRDVTISCVQDIATVFKPVIVDNCPGGELVLLNETTDILDCDPQNLRVITRTWTVKDAYGTFGDTCEQEIFIRRTDLNGIVWPGNFTGSSALQCGRFSANPDGSPKLSVTGIPTLFGVPLYPFNQSVICNGFVTYTDKITFNTSCKKIMTRTWEVGEWWCSSTNIRTWVQVIEIKDTEAPTIGNLQNITVSTLTKSCSGKVTLPAASITDNCNTWTVTVNTGEAVLNTNGGVTELSAGHHTVVYTATDACGNQSSKTMRVSVLDDTEPIPVCETRTVVSLKDDGTAWLFKTSVDDGSFDECGDIELKIRRMTTTCDTFSTNWVDAVGFCCADAGKEVMVALLVTDESGNTNQCMVTVEVQDKRLPVLTCPDNVTVSCTTAYDPNDLGPTFGEYIVSGGGCVDASSVSEVLTGSLDQCRIGVLTRTFTLRKNNAVLQTCAQTITFRPDQPFTEDMIIYPKDTTFVNSMCTTFDLDPDNLPLGYGRPQVTDDGVCNLVASSFEDDFYPFAGNGACFKIVRHWVVINWCSRDEFGKIWQDSFDQVLVVKNTIAPAITSSTTTREVCSLRSDCQPEFITLTASATDLCTPQNELRWTWEITFEDGAKQAGVGRDASGRYPFGNHHIVFEVEDKCGNVSRTEYDFNSLSCKAPTAYCKQGLSTSLIAMDTDANGIPDAEMVMLTPEFFDNGSYHSCGNGVQLSFSEDVNDTLLVLDCTHKNEEVEVELWVTDELGNQDFCGTFVLVEDNNNVNICPNNIQTDADVFGKVSSKNNEGIKDVTVTLVAQEQKVTLTDAEGNYMFSGLDKNENYQVVPSKSNDPLNGVSTLDLVIIQRHILGLDKIKDPYLMLAADINKDSKITVNDLVALRKIILGADANFINNESWRFIWDGQIWSDPNNPLTSALITNYDIQSLSQDMSINFIAYKTGDVNGNVIVNLNQSDNAETRSKHNVELIFDDKEVLAGERVNVAFRVNDPILMHGFQTSFKVNGIAALEVKNAYSHKNENGVVRLSYQFEQATVIDGNSSLFEMEFIAAQNGKISEMIQIVEEEIKSEAYVGEDLKVAQLRLRNNSGFNLETFSVAQNVPNPWNSVTVIPVAIPERDVVTTVVKDITGRVVVRRSMILEAGKNNIELNSDIFVPGAYTYEITYRSETKTGKMVMIE